MIVLGDNWDAKVIHGHLYASQTGSGYNKHFYSIKLCVRKHEIKPNIALLFWVTGKGISYFETILQIWCAIVMKKILLIIQKSLP